MGNYITTYYIGSKDKDTHKQKLSGYEISKIINETLDYAGIDSYTTSNVIGHYKGEIEHTVKLELVNNRLSLYYLNVLKEKLNQECIMVLTKECDVEFI